MATVNTSWEWLEPSYKEPDIITQWSQPSDFAELLPEGAQEVKLGPEDKMVYIKSLAIRTMIASGMSNANNVPSVDIETSFVQAPTYLQQVRAIYDHHQTKMAGLWGYSIVEAQRLGMQQGHYQYLRNKCLYGENANEGILNAPGATAATLPPDSYGHTTFGLYDNGQMAFYLLQLMQEIKARTYQGHLSCEFTILGPQEVVMPWEYQDIVQLTSMQRDGAGSLSVAGTVKSVLEKNGDKVKFGYDDTLIGQGAGGTDAVIIVIPQLTKPMRPKLNTNEFARITNGFLKTVALYTDVPAPIEIPTPIAGGAIDVLSEMRATSGWGIQSQAITILSGAP